MQSIDKLGDPILTLRVLLTAVECESSPTNQATNVIPSGGQLSVLVIFPTCVLLLARNKAMDVYEFTVSFDPNFHVPFRGCLFMFLVTYLYTYGSNKRLPLSEHLMIDLLPRTY